MRIFLDPWSSEYSPSLQAETPRDSTPPEVQLDIEGVPWELIKPTISERKKFVFIDGVRRVEARIILEQEGISYGLFGSVGVGSVLMGKPQLNFFQELLSSVRVQRYCITAGGASLETPISLSPNLIFEPISVKENGIDVPLQTLQKVMREIEGEVAATIHRESDVMVVADGPLQISKTQSSLLGYIKSFHEWYLPQSHFAILHSMQVRERTPLFLIGGQAGISLDRFGWFVRLSTPERGDSPLSGLARLEVSATSGLEMAKRLANDSTELHRFVAKKYRDPRSPQNLIPIGALEKSLRHLMGESAIIQRSIQGWIREKHSN